MNVSARVKASQEAPSATTATGPSSVGPAGELVARTARGMAAGTAGGRPVWASQKVSVGADELFFQLLLLTTRSVLPSCVCVLYRKLFSAFFSLGRLPFILK